MATSEFMGTFFIVFVSGWSILLWQKGQISLVGLGLANGMATAGAVWAGFDASGAHFNPVVTFVRFITGRFPVSRALAYVLIQLGASAVATVLAMLLSPKEFQRDPSGPIGRPRRNEVYSDFQVFLFEFVGGMLYIFIYYASVVDKRAPQNVFGFSLGAVITVCTLAFGKATGACINPVRLFGAQLLLGFGAEGANYWVALLAGGIFIGLYYDAFILKSSAGSFEAEESSQVQNMVTAENVNQAMNLKY